MAKFSLLQGIFKIGHSIGGGGNDDMQVPGSGEIHLGLSSTCSRLVNLTITCPERKPSNIQDNVVSGDFCAFSFTFFSSNRTTFSSLWIKV